MSVSTNISLLPDVSLSEWGGMSQNAQNEALENFFGPLTPEQQGELRDVMMETARQYEETLKSYAKDLRIMERAGRRSDGGGSDAAASLDQVNECLLALTDFEGDLQRVVAESIQHYQSHNRNNTDGGDVAVSQYEMGDPGDDIEENTYTFTLAGNAMIPGLSEDNSNLSNEEWLEEEGVTEDGVVAKDEHPDGILNQADIDAALLRRNDPTLKQKVFFVLEPGHTLSLESYNPEIGEVVYKVTDPEGNFAYFEFKNVPSDVVFGFNSGVTEAELRTWNPELLKDCRFTEGDGTVAVDTVYDRLFGTDEIPEEERLEVIPDYTEVRDGWAVSRPFADRGLVENEFTAAKYVVDRLFLYLGEGNISVDALKDVREEIEAKFDELRLTVQQRAKIWQRVIVHCAILTPDNFARFFGPAVGWLESQILAGGEAEPSAGAKLAILLLETKAGAGSYGGEAIWNQLFPDPNLGGDGTGTWQGAGSRASSLEALQNYKTIVSSHMDGQLDHRFNNIQTYLETGEDPIETDDPTAPATAFILSDGDKVVTTFPTAIYRFVITNINDLAHRFSSEEDQFTSVSNGLRGFFTALNNAGPMTVQEMRDWILGQFETSAASQDVIAAVINILFIECGTGGTADNSNFFSALIDGNNGRDWANKVYALLYDDDMTDSHVEALIALGFTV